MPNRNPSAPRSLLFAALLALITILATDVNSAASRGAFETADFTIRWPDRWRVANQSDTNLVLEDGFTYVHMVGLYDDTDPAAAIPGIVENWFSLYPGENITQVPGSSRAGQDRASTVYTYGYRDANDSLTLYAVRMEARQVKPGLLLWIIVDTQWGLYNADPGIFAAVLDSLDIAGSATNGETHPTFVASNWRVGVAAVSAGEEFPQFGLMPQEGRQWLVLIADLTNWSVEPRAVALREFIIATPNERTEPSALHTQMVSRSLGLQDPVSTSEAVAVSTTLRTAMAFSIPATATDIQLHMNEQFLPIDGLITEDISGSSLPPESRSPHLQEGTLVSLLGGSRLIIQTASGEQEVVLLGSSLPGPSDCYFRESTVAAFAYVGSNVLLEADSSVLGEGILYLWVIESDGNRVLLNQALVADGAARVTALPESARFALWMSTSESIANRDSRGLWESCGGPLTP